MGPLKDPTEQRTGDLDPPFKDGGRRADLPADYQQRAAADIDYARNLATVRRWDREAIGIPTSREGVAGGRLSGTRGRDAER